jgi:hypothetical protein
MAAAHGFLIGVLLAQIFLVQGSFVQKSHGRFCSVYPL